MEENHNPVNIIRSSKREDLKDLRNKHKEAVLCNKRLGLNEISEYIRDINVSEFKELILKLKQRDVSVEVIRKIKNSLINSENIEAFFKNDGAMSSLIRILIGSDALKQIEATACLTNLACGSHKCCLKVAKVSGAYLALFINGSNYILKEQSAWAAGNIANDCLDCFNIIKSQGILPALIKNIKSPVPGVVQSVVFALNACTRYEEPEIISLIQSGLPKELLCLLDVNNVTRSIFLDAAFTLSNCCYLCSKYCLEDFNLETVEMVVSALNEITCNAESDILMTTPLIRCLGFLSYSDKVCELISEKSELYESIQIILSTEGCVHLKKEILWVLSNVLSKEPLTASHTYFKPLVDSLKHLTNSENTADLQVLYFLSVLSSASEELRLLLKQHDIYSIVKCLSRSKQAEIKQAATVFSELVEL